VESRHSEFSVPSRHRKSEIEQQAAVKTASRTCASQWFQRDGVMPTDPSACSPGVSQSSFSVSSTQCGAQVEAKARSGGALRKRLSR
jgi:hypothetical protein